MTEPLIEAWLDDELDEEGVARLEKWLREDPSHMRQFVHAVAMQEDLKAIHRKSADTRTIPSMEGSRIRWLPIAGAAAAVLLFVFLLNIEIPHTPVRSDGPRQTNSPHSYPGLPTVDPTPPHGLTPFGVIDDKEPNQQPEPGDPSIKIVNGDLVLSSVKENKPRSPGNPDPKAVTKTVKSGAKGVSLRWEDDVELTLDPRTTVRLHGRERAPTATLGRRISLDSGGMRLSRRRLERPFAEAPVEIVTRGGRIIVNDADCSIADLSEHSGIAGITINVSTGSVRVIHTTGEQVVKVGETATFPLSTNLTDRAP